MSNKRIEVTTETEEENFDVFSDTLKKIMETSPADRGPAGKAIMSAFQVYHDMIGGVAARSEKLTR